MKYAYENGTSQDRPIYIRLFIPKTVCGDKSIASSKTSSPQIAI
jgi:hypothetical protein